MQEHQYMKKYKTNPSMEFIPLDETEQVIHDNESGDIHYVDETSAVILDLLSSPMTSDELIGKLLDMFEGDPDEIRADTIEFLDELVAKNIIIADENEN